MRLCGSHGLDTWLCGCHRANMWLCDSHRVDMWLCDNHRLDMWLCGSYRVVMWRCGSHRVDVVFGAFTGGKSTLWYSQGEYVTLWQSRGGRMPFYNASIAYILCFHLLVRCIYPVSVSVSLLSSLCPYKMILYPITSHIDGLF